MWDRSLCSFWFFVIFNLKLSMDDILAHTLSYCTIMNIDLNRSK